MPRTKTDRPVMTFTGSATEALALLTSGVREDGLTMIQQDYKFLQSYLVGRDGQLTFALQEIDNRIKNAIPRSPEKSNLRGERARIVALMNRVRSDVSAKLADMSYARAMNAVEREQKRGESTRSRFVRDYEFLRDFDQEFLADFLDDPDTFIKNFQMEAEQREKNAEKVEA